MLRGIGFLVVGALANNIHDASLNLAMFTKKSWLEVFKLQAKGLLKSHDTARTLSPLNARKSLEQTPDISRMVASPTLRSKLAKALFTQKRVLDEEWRVSYVSQTSRDFATQVTDVMDRRCETYEELTGGEEVSDERWDNIKSASGHYAYERAEKNTKEGKEIPEYLLNDSDVQTTYFLWTFVLFFLTLLCYMTCFMWCLCCSCCRVCKSHRDQDALALNTKVTLFLFALAAIIVLLIAMIFVPMNWDHLSNGINGVFCTLTGFFHQLTNGQSAEDAAKIGAKSAFGGLLPIISDVEDIRSGLNVGSPFHTDVNGLLDNAVGVDISMNQFFETLDLTVRNMEQVTPEYLTETVDHHVCYGCEPLTLAVTTVNDAVKSLSLAAQLKMIKDVIRTTIFGEMSDSLKDAFDMVGEVLGTDIMDEMIAKDYGKKFIKKEYEDKKDKYVEYIYFAMLFILGMLVFLSLCGCCANKKFFDYTNNSAGLRANSPPPLLMVRMGDGGSTKTFACFTWCTTCLLALLILLVASLVGTGGFALGNVCMWMNGLDSGRTSNTIQYWSDEPGLDADTAKLFDVCMTEAGSGAILDTLTIKTCDMDEDGNYPAECDDSEKVDMAVSKFMLEVITNTITGVFEGMSPDPETTSLLANPDFGATVELLHDVMSIPFEATILPDPLWLPNSKEYGIIFTDDRIVDLLALGSDPSLAKAAATGLACDDFDGSAANLGKLAGINSLLDSIYTYTYPTNGSTTNLVTAVTAANKDLWTANNNANSDCTFSQPTCTKPTVDQAKVMLIGCKLYHETVGDWTASDTTKYDAVLEDLVMWGTENAEYEHFFPDQAYPNHPAGAYQCNPCQAAVYMVGNKKALRERGSLMCESAVTPVTGGVCDLNTVTSGNSDDGYTHAPDCMSELSDDELETDPDAEKYFVEFTSTSCSLKDVIVEHGKMADYMMAAITRVDAEVGYFAPQIIGKAADWEASPRTTGDGLQGFITNGLINPLLYGMIDKLNCKFLFGVWDGVQGSLCLFGTFGMIEMGKNFVWIGVGLWLYVCVMKMIWRFVQDNLDAEEAAQNDPVAMVAGAAGAVGDAVTAAATKV